MFTIAYPMFERGRIMKKEMLLALRNYSFGLAKLQFGDLTNGIVTGCELSVIGTSLTISPGIFKFNNFIYMMTESQSIDCEPTERITVVKVRFSSTSLGSDYIHYSGNIILDANTKLEENEIELCRFKLKQGSNLRTEYVDFDDIQTEYDTVNLANATWAGIDEPWIALPILKRFAKDALPCYLSEPWDISFCSQCMSNERIHRRVILAYLQAKDISVQDNISNLEIYSGLNIILRELQGRSRPNITRDRRKPMIVID